MNKAINFVHNWSWILLLLFCLTGIFYPLIGIVALICMLSPSIVAFWKGRLWCGNFCPRGSFNDRILVKLSRKKKIPDFMKTTWFKLLFLVLLMGAFTVQLAYAWGDMAGIGKVFVRMIIITTLVTIGLGITFHQRTWCAICPMGTMAHLVTLMKKRSPFRKHVTFRKEACVNCKLCTKVCPVGIDVFSCKEKGMVDDPGCLKCNQCIIRCPKKSLSMI